MAAKKRQVRGGRRPLATVARPDPVSIDDPKRFWSVAFGVAAHWLSQLDATTGSPLMTRAVILAMGEGWLQTQPPEMGETFADAVERLQDLENVGIVFSIEASGQAIASDSYPGSGDSMPEGGVVTEGMRYLRGTRVRWQKQGKRALLGRLVDDCAEWHSFATVLFDGDREPCSVWVGDIQVVEVKP
jgi:hypothetical protein